MPRRRTSSANAAELEAELEDSAEGALNDQHDGTRKRARVEAAEERSDTVPAGVPAFVRSTWAIWHNPEYADVVSWMVVPTADGTSMADAIAVTNEQRFAKHVLPRYFKHHNYSSFTRNLNLYGFTQPRTHSGERVFMHPHFARWRPQDLLLVRRRRARDEAHDDADTAHAAADATTRSGSRARAHAGAVVHAHAAPPPPAQQLLLTALQEADRRNIHAEFAANKFLRMLQGALSDKGLALAATPHGLALRSVDAAGAAAEVRDARGPSQSAVTSDAAAASAQASESRVLTWEEVGRMLRGGAPLPGDASGGGPTVDAASDDATAAQALAGLQQGAWHRYLEPAHAALLDMTLLPAVPPQVHTAPPAARSARVQPTSTSWSAVEGTTQVSTAKDEQLPVELPVPPAPAPTRVIAPPVQPQLLHMWSLTEEAPTSAPNASPEWRGLPMTAQPSFDSLSGQFSPVITSGAPAPGLSQSRSINSVYLPGLQSIPTLSGARIGSFPSTGFQSPS